MISSRCIKTFFTFNMCLFFAYTVTGQVSQQTSLEKSAPRSSSWASTAGSRTYRFGAGLRAGTTPGITFKYFLTKKSALETIAAIMPEGFGIALLYEQYNPLTSKVEGLNVYYGAGLHASFYTGRIYYAAREPEPFFRDDGNSFGVDAIFGLEYKILPAPIAVSVDIKPAFEISLHGNTYMRLDPGLGAKYTF